MFEKIKSAGISSDQTGKEDTVEAANNKVNRDETENETFQGTAEFEKLT